jgi:hypothetical protein
MTAATSRQPIRRRRRTCLADKVLIVALLAFGFSSVFQLFWSVPSHAQEAKCDAAYLATLPAPPKLTPKLHRVVQLVNCSNETLLGTANAAHNSSSSPTPVFPREGTWVMLPFGSPDNKNVLTIDIPAEWEGTANTTPKDRVQARIYGREQVAAMTQLMA